MSKSLGNFFTVRDLLDQGYPGEVIRLVMLGTHYSKPMDWTAEKAKQAEATLRKWESLCADIEPASTVDPMVIAALANDLDTVGAISVLHDLAKHGELAVLTASARLLGFSFFRVEAEDEYSAALNEMISLRAAFKNTKEYQKADQVRGILVEMGFEVSDSADGTLVEMSTLKLLRYLEPNTTGQARTSFFAPGSFDLRAAQREIARLLKHKLEALK